MPGFIAKQLCPELIIVPCNFNKYHQVSGHVMELISNYDVNYKAMSLDEAYLDLTDHLVKRQTLNVSERTYPKEYDSNEETITFGLDIEDCVRELRHRIYLTTRGLTASSGIACNLRLAKLCSDVNKPNGQYLLKNDQIIDFIRKIPIRKFNGIGPSMTQTLEAYGIKICQDLYDKRAMIKLLETQNTFEFLMHVCMGIGANMIEHNDVRKSIGHET
jgi:DNA polymerase kappa